MFELRFPQSRFGHWASLYEPPLEEAFLIDEAPRVRAAGFIDEELLHKVAKWKSPRSAGHASKNEPAFLKEITRFALSAREERSRAEVLTLLDGVDWPTASVILHLFHKEPYHILDFRALWSLQCDRSPPYDFRFWWSYVEFFRTICVESSNDVRTVDRALWQYSKANQKSA